jgi:hypothetical protein
MVMRKIVYYTFFFLSAANIPLKSMSEITDFIEFVWFMTNNQLVCTVANKLLFPKKKSAYALRVKELEIQKAIATAPEIPSDQKSIALERIKTLAHLNAMEELRTIITELQNEDRFRWNKENTALVQDAQQLLITLQQRTRTAC